MPSAKVPRVVVLVREGAGPLQRWRTRAVFCARVPALELARQLHAEGLRVKVSMRTAP